MARSRPAPEPARRLALRALAAAAFLLAHGPVAAQEPPSFTETIDVNVINVRVHVTDADGRPVVGLTADDFEVFENGQKMTISNFFAVGAGTDDAGVLGEARAAPADELAASGLEVPGPSPADGPAEVGHVVLVVDNTNLRPQNRAKVSSDLRAFLAGRAAGPVRVMVVTIHQHYRVRQEFTGDTSAVERVLAEIEDDPADGTFSNATLRMLIREIDAFSISGSPDEQLVAAQMRSTKRAILVAIEQQARLDHQRARATIEALRYLAGSIAGLPGRKTVVYVSEGLPMRPAEALFHAHYSKFAPLDQSLDGVPTDLDPPEIASVTYDLSGELEDLVKHLQASDIALYTIDAAGQRPLESGSAARRLTDSRTLDLSGGGWSTALDLLHEQNLQSPLRLVSTETGAALLANNRDYAGFFGDVWRDMESYYSLGYQAPHPKEGLFYEIDVKVKRKGVRVRHARSYADKTWEQRLVDMTVSRLLVGEGANPLDVEIGLGEPVEKKEGLHHRFVQPVRIFVPMDRLLLIPQGDRQVGRALAVVMVKDDLGNTSPPRMIRLHVDFDAVARSDEPGRAYADLDLLMRPGEQTLAVGVRDELAGETSTVDKTVWLVPAVEPDSGGDDGS